MKALDPRRSGLLVAGLQAALLLAIGANMLLDRALRPRGWGRTEPVDPNLPIRGRYVDLRLVVPAPGLAPGPLGSGLDTRVRLTVKGDRLVAVSPAGGPGSSEPLPAVIEAGADGTVARLRQPLAFFLSEHVEDPSRRPRSEALWVEVSLPARGAPRPIRLGVGPPGARGAIVPLGFR